MGNSIGKVLEGELNNLAGAGVACTVGQCQTDTFSVSGPPNSPPIICGDNADQHMYVDVSCTDCIDLGFQLGPGGATRQWSIKVTQISCNDENRAPEGCTQYYYGSDTGTIQTYNFDGGSHLANQRQQICIRQEAGNCRNCYSHAAIDFGTGGVKSSSGHFSACCNMGQAGNLYFGPDCVLIPGVVKTIAANQNTISN